MTLHQPWSSPSAIALPLATNGEAADADVAAQFLGLGFRQADRGDLRLAIGAARNLALVRRMHVRQAGDLLDADDAFMLGLVGEHRRAGDVADRIDARDVGLAVAVDDDAAAIGLHAERFKAEIFDIALHADGGDHPVGGDLLDLAVFGLDVCGDAVRRPSRPSSPWRLGEDLHAALFQLLAGDGGDFRILDRHDRSA